MSFTNQLREAIKQSGLSYYRIARETKTEERRISNFVRGKGGLNLVTLDRIAEYLKIRAALASASATTISQDAAGVQVNAF